MNQMTIKVSGMTCIGCERSVERAVSAVSGVTLAKADHTKGLVLLHYNAPKPSNEQLSQAIDRIGYKFEGILN